MATGASRWRSPSVKEGRVPPGGGELAVSSGAVGQPEVEPLRRAATHPPRRAPRARGLDVAIPGAGRLVAAHLVLDFNGTLAEAGVLPADVARRLSRLARRFQVTVLTADTFGTAAAALRGVPVSLHPIRTGRDKGAFVRRRAADGVVAVGNGVNDRAMLRGAALGIAVLGPEGMDPRLVASAKIVSRCIEDALDLLLDPRRLVATLRT